MLLISKRNLTNLLINFEFMCFWFAKGISLLKWALGTKNLSKKSIVFQIASFSKHEISLITIFYIYIRDVLSFSQLKLNIILYYIYV